MRRAANVVLFVIGCLVASILVSQFARDSLGLDVPQKWGDTFTTEDDFAVTPTDIATGNTLMTPKTETVDPRFVARTSQVFLVITVKVAAEGRRGSGTLTAYIDSHGVTYQARDNLSVPAAGFYSGGTVTFEMPKDKLEGAKLRIDSKFLLTAIHDVPVFDLGLDAAAVSDLSMTGRVTQDPLPDPQVIT